MILIEIILSVLAITSPLLFTLLSSIFMGRPNNMAHDREKQILKNIRKKSGL